MNFISIIHAHSYSLFAVGTQNFINVCETSVQRYITKYNTIKSSTTFLGHLPTYVGILEKLHRGMRKRVEEVRSDFNPRHTEESK